MEWHCDVVTCLTNHCVCASVSATACICVIYGSAPNSWFFEGKPQTIPPSPPLPPPPSIPTPSLPPKEWFGVGKPPADAQWLELTRRDPEAGTVERMGKEIAEEFRRFTNRTSDERVCTGLNFRHSLWKIFCWMFAVCIPRTTHMRAPHPLLTFSSPLPHCRPRVHEHAPLLLSNSYAGRCAYLCAYLGNEF